MICVIKQKRSKSWLSQVANRTVVRAFELSDQKNPLGYPFFVLSKPNKKVTFKASIFVTTVFTNVDTFLKEALKLQLPLLKM